MTVPMRRRFTDHDCSSGISTAAKSILLGPQANRYVTTCSVVLLLGTQSTSLLDFSITIKVYTRRHRGGVHIDAVDGDRAAERAQVSSVPSLRLHPRVKLLKTYSSTLPRKRDSVWGMRRHSCSVRCGTEFSVNAESIYGHALQVNP